ncbi:MAG TPA: GH25 family lysozyme [Candidatus Limnocylindria bacterium]|nr:GH25 family lysozyme [Candidatus Limnocylindria bacterium]
MRRLSAALIALAAAVAALVAAYEWGFVRVNYPSLAEFPVRGIDVSRYQGTVDWQAVAASGVHFAFIKATEGGDHRDPRFAENWDASARAGVVRGAYHFFTFCTPGAAQAANLTAVVPPDPEALPPAVDVEFAGNCRRWESIDAIRRELDVFLGLTARAYGRRPIVYFTRESWERILDGRLDGHATWARSLFGRPHARFGVWAFWQYAHNGRVRGIDGLVDLNVFQGSREALLALRDGVVPAAVAAGAQR